MERITTAASDEEPGLSRSAKIVIAIVAVLGLLAVGIANAPTTSKGANDTLYEAIAFHHVGITNEQADTYVDQLAQQQKISFSAAEKMAVSFTAKGITPAVWLQLATAQAGYEAAVAKGIVDPTRAPSPVDAVASVGQR